MPARLAAEGAHRAAITVCVILATVMQALDTTIANIALPYIQGSVSASQDQINWVLTSYIVAAAIMTPLTGWLADRFGIRRTFLVSVAGFTAASVLCGLATSLVDRMEAAGWVERRTSATDRRVNEIHLLPRAEGALDDALAVGDALHARALAGLGAAERKTLITLLQKARDGLLALEAEAVGEEQGA